MDELKPCPFCGAEILDMDYDYIPNKDDRLSNREWWITCYECPCQGVRIVGTKKEAIKAWNQRT